MNFDHYVYPGMDILKNKLGITDKQMAYDFERTFSSKRIGVLQKQGITGRFDTAHLKAIHKFVFGDIYDWAGEFRDIQIFKGLTEFTAPEKIQFELDVLCADIRDKNYFRGLSKYAAADGLADAMCRLNQIHPFREGNGRTQRLFMEQMALNAGYILDFSQVSENAMRNASFFASVRGDSRPMQCLFASSMTDAGSLGPVEYTPVDCTRQRNSSDLDRALDNISWPDNGPENGFGFA